MKAFAVLAAVWSLCICTRPATAQTFQGQITGEVRDTSGAVMPNVKLTATNIATNVSFETQSNEEGIYRFLALPPAQYKIAASMTGFKSYEQGPITVQVNDNITLNIELQLGDATERVVVQAAAEALQTSNATIGQVITTRTIEALPLNARDPLALIGLTPGVTFGANFGNGGGQELGRNFFKSDFNVGGGRSGSQELLLDGAANTTPDINRGIINPPVDSVQEFKVQANSYDAEFGRTSGGVINVITKSGTNDFHGLVYDFERHSFIEANNWFNNASRIPNPSFKRHQFGGNIGGPIIKGKTFFFADYEGLRQGFPITFVTTVPTLLQRSGNFSQTVAAGNQPITIYDPLTAETLPNGQRQRSAFPGNIIPANRIDPVSRRLADLFPEPNQPGNALGQNNYIRSAGSTIDTDKWDARVDHTFTQNTRIFGRYSQQKDVRVVPGPLPPPLGGGRDTTDTYRQALLDLTHVFSPSLLATAQFSFSRALATQFGLSRGFDFSSLGFPANINAIAVDQVPSATIRDIPANISNAADSFVQYQPRNLWAMRAGINQSRGAHNLKYGVDRRILNFNEGQNTAPSGNYEFTRAFTQGPIANIPTPTGGHGFADFLLGTPFTGNFRLINPISTQGLYTALYFQDDWRVSQKLTLNLGIRWDLQQGNREKWGRIAWFDPDAPSPIAQAAGLPNLRGAVRWVNGDNGRNQQDTPLTDFAPRIGLAYKITDKLVLRTGYGLFYVPRNIQGNNLGAITAFRDTPMVTSLDNNITPLNRLSNPYPQGVLPPVNDRDPGANIGAQIQAPFYENKSSYTQLWSFALQWEMPGRVVMQAMYWGNKGTNLLAPSQNINQLPNEYLSLGNALNDQVPNPFFGVITAGPLSSRTISRRQSLLPFPQYSGESGVQRVFAPFGNSSCNGATLQAERRLAQSLTFLLGYTWSKAIDDVNTPIDVYNRRLSRALSAFDTPHQFIGSWVYQLPVGKGRQLDLGGAANAILGAWDLSGIVRIQSGQPVTINTPAVNNGRSGKLDNPSIGQWFDTRVFSAAAPFTFGNIGTRSPDIRTDFTRNVDVVMVKKFPFTIKDREIVPQFRAECFNLFNTPQFAAPNGMVTSQQFGTVTRQANTSRQFQFGLKIAF
ncbi:MAG TPA: carboxypeptidase regulatory-like domain-containing protein [Bryobacteraceae bacterium]|nr:carboxypeptidase regulatory-like domain-containing protein [Bryobacteraceae bacterium]